MIDWALVTACLIMGFVGSAHCAGMCGPLIGLMEQGDSGRLGDVRRRVAYHFGRLLFYGVLTLSLSLLGAGLVQAIDLNAFTLALRFAAAGLLALLALQLLFGWRSFSVLERFGVFFWRRLSPVLEEVFPLDRGHKAVLAGFVWGSIPCGMLYAAAVVAASALSVPAALLAIFAFWLATTPVLGLIGATAGIGYRLSQRYGGVLLLGIAVISVAILVIPVDVTGHDHSSTEHNMPHHH